jgi:hypothetical protein
MLRVGGWLRFATIFLYLTDVELGGETVFANAPPLGQSDKIPEDEALKLVSTVQGLSESCLAHTGVCLPAHHGAAGP